MSVVTWVVNAVSSAEGTSARPIQPSRSAQVGTAVGAGAGCRRCTGCRSRSSLTLAAAHQHEDEHEGRHQQQEAEGPQAAQLP